MISIKYSKIQITKQKVELKHKLINQYKFKKQNLKQYLI